MTKMFRARSVRAHFLLLYLGTVIPLAVVSAAALFNDSRVNRHASALPEKIAVSIGMTERLCYKTYMRKRPSIRVNP